MSNPTIVCLGPKGTNGHFAALHLQLNFSKSTIVFADSHQEIFETVANSEYLSCGVVPIENSSEGLVGDVVDYWINNWNTPLQVIREIEVPIRHNVLIREDADIKDVKKIFSRFEALAQCRRNLEKRGFAFEVVSSTAKAAELVLNSSEIGVVGSQFLGQVWGLKVGVGNLNDHNNNVTRFHVVSKKECPHDGDGRTAILIHINDVAGSFVKILNVFAEAGINVSLIRTHPDREMRGMFVYMDLDCYATDPHFPLFSQIQSATNRYMMLGSFDRHIMH